MIKELGIKLHESRVSNQQTSKHTNFGFQEGGIDKKKACCQTF